MPNVSEHTRSIWQDLKKRKVFLACSGGVDSMVLMHILWSLKVELSVIHVNYHLRGEASNLDAELVIAVCERLAIPFEIRSVHLKKRLKNGGNLQDEARKVRYSWFQEILDEHPNYRVALAHHRDDQLETFFLNLARKSGVLGLSCMMAEHRGIVRPLLDFSRREILKYAKENSIQWREDASNSSNTYTRNRLRNEFIPFLKSEIPNLNASVSLLIDRFQLTQLELEATVNPIIESIRERNLLLVSEFENLSEWERVELLRQLGISSSYIPRILQLKERGKHLEFTHSEFDLLVRDEKQYTFLNSQTHSFKLIQEEVQLLPTEFDKHTAYFDAEKIQGKLQVHKWEMSDRISPLGMKGSQLVSDIIKDAKITAYDKRKQCVVHDDVSILWCVGLKISRKAIADDQSKKIIRCSVIVSEVEESELP